MTHRPGTIIVRHYTRFSAVLAWEYPTLPEAQDAAREIAKRFLPGHTFIIYDSDNNPIEEVLS